MGGRFQRSPIDSRGELRYRIKAENRDFCGLLTAKIHNIKQALTKPFCGGCMVLTFQGYFEAGQFVADTPVQIPEGRKTIITVLDEVVNKETKRDAYKKRWNKIIETIRNSDEILEGEPERFTRLFKTPEEIDAL
jgi:hypothetical protein